MAHKIKEKRITEVRGLNQDAFNVRLTDNRTGEVVFNEDSISVLFTTVKEDKEETTEFGGGMAGTFSQATMMASLEANAVTVLSTLKEEYNLTAGKALDYLAQLTHEAVKEVYTKDEIAEGMAENMAEIAASVMLKKAVKEARKGQK